MLFVSFQVMSNAEIMPKVSYTFCWSDNRTFDADGYDHSRDCDDITVIMSLASSNNATTEGTGIAYKRKYKEAYVGIKNASGTWKTDTVSNETLAYVTANVDPLLFTPIMSQHDVIAYESSSLSFKMHSRVYN